MKTYSITPENEITAFANTAGAREAARPGTAIFGTEDTLLAATADCSIARLVAIWNGLPGVRPVKKFTNRRVAVRRIWKAIQHLQPAPRIQRQAQEHAPKAARQGTKRAIVLALLGQARGTTVGEIRAAVGWQPHSVRGFLSNLNRTGTRVESFRDEGRERAYRIAPQNAGAASGADGDPADTGEVR